MTTKKKKPKKQYEAVVLMRGIYIDSEKEDLIRAKAKQYGGINSGSGYSFLKLTRDLAFLFKTAESRRNFLRCGLVKNLCRKKTFVYNRAC